MKFFLIILAPTLSLLAGSSSSSTTEEIVAAAITHLRTELVPDTGASAVEAWGPSGVDAAAVANLAGGEAMPLDSVTGCYSNPHGVTNCHLTEGFAASFQIMAASIIGTEATTTIHVNTNVITSDGPILYRRTVAVVLDQIAGTWVVRRYEILMES